MLDILFAPYIPIMICFLYIKYYNRSYVKGIILMTVFPLQTQEVHKWVLP